MDNIKRVKLGKRLYNFAVSPFCYAAKWLVVKWLCSEMTILCKPYFVVKCNQGLHLNCFSHAYIITQ